MTLTWLNKPPASLHESAARQATARQTTLTKPPGSLGELEKLAVRLAAMQGSVYPHLEHIHITVFASDHGVAAEGVSAFPQSVTAAMLRNFIEGGAAISVLARELGAHLEVINLGVATSVGPIPGVIDSQIAAGTANSAVQAAMTRAQLHQAFAIGRERASRALARGAELFIGGEMGIANTTAASAVACALLAASAVQLTGAGTGLDQAGIIKKRAVIERVLNEHRQHFDDPMEILSRCGGFEIAALTAACITCAQNGLPVLVDGFIVSVAALAACRLLPNVRDWLLFSHRSAEASHSLVLQALGAEPLLDLSLRLGEGSGAAVAVPLLRLACSLHNNMATFEAAGVADKL